MAYGLRVKKADGTVILDTTDLVSRIRYYHVAEANESDSTTLSDISGKTTYAFSVPLEDMKVAHAVSISGTTFSWTLYAGPPLAASKSLVGVIIVD